MKPEGLQMRIGETKAYAVHGVTLTVLRKPEPPKITPGSTAFHEARHVVTAGEIHYATIIPSGDSLGATMPVVMTAMAAMAAYSTDPHGSGWDRFLTEHFLGVNPDGAASAAASFLAGQQDFLFRVAQKLEEYGTITQAHVNQAKEEVDNERNGNVDAIVLIQQADGSREEHKAKAKGFNVMVLGEWYELAPSRNSEETLAPYSGSRVLPEAGRQARNDSVRHSAKAEIQEIPHDR